MIILKISFEPLFSFGSYLVVFFSKPH